VPSSSFYGLPERSLVTLAEYRAERSLVHPAGCWAADLLEEAYGEVFRAGQCGDFWETRGVVARTRMVCEALERAHCREEGLERHVLFLTGGFR
jgi:hypothetical protein